MKIREKAKFSARDAGLIDTHTLSCCEPNSLCSLAESHAITDNASCKHYCTIHLHCHNSFPLCSFLFTPFHVTPSGPRILYHNDVACFCCETTFLYGALQRSWTLTTRFAFVFFMHFSSFPTHSNHPFYWNPELPLCSLISYNETLFILFYLWRASWPQEQCYCWLCVCFRRWLWPFAQQRTLFAWRVVSTVTLAVLVLRPQLPPTLLVIANPFLYIF